jgi:hypothetical protein
MAIVLNGATSGNVSIDANAVSGTSIITLPVGSGTFPLMTLSTAVATTSGTAIDFTSIPSWVKRITIMFNEVSLNGTAHYLIQLGDSGGVETTGYISTSVNINNASGTAGASSTSGFTITSLSAAGIFSGHLTLTLIGSNLWIGSHSGKLGTANITSGGGSKTLSDTLDRVRITTSNGTDTFDAGSINILMEGY